MTAEFGRTDGGESAPDGSGGERRRFEVCPVDDLPPGSRTIVDVAGREIGVFNVDGELYAIHNVCPHQLAPLCQGQLVGEMTAPAVGEYELTREGEIIQCPWHCWRFDLATGESVFNPHLRTGSYHVTVERTRASSGENDTPAPGDPESDRTDEETPMSEYGTELAGEDPPVDTYDVAVEREIVVLYL